MRQYRGLTKDGKWVYGYPLEFEDMSIIFECGESTLICKALGKPLSYISSDFWVEVIPETVGQSTGLKDKNGKEIYGDDIVKYMDGANMEVFYSPNDYAGWKLRRKPNHGKGLLIYGLYNRKGGSGAEEIIGNIHQPELPEKPK